MSAGAPWQPPQQPSQQPPQPPEEWRLQALASGKAEGRVARHTTSIAQPPSWSPSARACFKLLSIRARKTRGGTGRLPVRNAGSSCACRDAGRWLACGGEEASAAGGCDVQRHLCCCRPRCCDCPRLLLFLPPHLHGPSINALQRRLGVLQERDVAACRGHEREGTAGGSAQLGARAWQYSTAQRQQPFHSPLLPAAARPPSPSKASTRNSSEGSAGVRKKWPGTLTPCIGRPSRAATCTV